LLYYVITVWMSRIWKISHTVSDTYTGYEV
jgi:hypothetical protein